MIHTVLCRRCGQVLEASIDFAPGIPLAQSPPDIRTKAQAAQIRHAERCPAGRMLASPHASGQPARARGTWAVTRVLRRARRRLHRLAL